MKDKKPTIFRISRDQMIFDAVVIGGGGHDGFPLAIMLSSRGISE
jgi:hypothetical protein